MPEPAAMEETVRRSVLRAHQHRRLVGGYVACTCGEDWTDHAKHVAEKLTEAAIPPESAGGPT